MRCFFYLRRDRQPAKKVPAHDLLICLFAFFLLFLPIAAIITQRVKHSGDISLYSPPYVDTSVPTTICFREGEPFVFPRRPLEKRSALMPKTRGRRGGKNSRASLKSLPRRMREDEQRCLVSKPSVRLWGVSLGKWREGNPASPSARKKKNHVPPSLRCVV